MTDTVTRLERSTRGSGADPDPPGDSGGDTMTDEDLQARVEAALLVAEDPITASELGDHLDVHGRRVRGVLERLRKEFERDGRGFQLLNVAGGFKLTTREEHYDFLKKMFGQRTVPRLSDAAVETLVIVAYRQPVIRNEIEDLRGVNSQSVLSTLLEEQFIRIAGRRDEIGRPIEYRTTSRFLDYFGLTSLDDLPDPREIDELLDE